MWCREKAHKQTCMQLYKYRLPSTNFHWQTQATDNMKIAICVVSPWIYLVGANFVKISSKSPQATNIDDICSQLKITWAFLFLLPVLINKLLVRRCRYISGCLWGGLGLPCIIQICRLWSRQFAQLRKNCCLCVVFVRMHAFLGVLGHTAIDTQSET